MVDDGTNVGTASGTITAEMMTTDSFLQASAVEQGCKFFQFSTCERMYIT